MFFLKPDLADLKLTASKCTCSQVGSKVHPFFQSFHVLFHMSRPQKKTCPPNPTLLGGIRWWCCFAKETSSHSSLCHSSCYGGCPGTLSQQRERFLAPDSVQKLSRTRLNKKMGTPRKTNGWSLKILSWKRRSIYKPPIFGLVFAGVHIFWYHGSQSPQNDSWVAKSFHNFPVLWTSQASVWCFFNASTIHNMVH